MEIARQQNNNPMTKTPESTPKEALEGIPFNKPECADQSLEKDTGETQGLDPTRAKIE